MRRNKPELLALCVAVCLAAGTQDVRAAEAGVMFGDAIQFAQARCVKIFGAGIGRDPGYATGLLVSPEGHVLTAQGIYLAGERIRVATPDGAIHLATVERRSEALQCALLKIDAKTPEHFDLSHPSAAQKGDWVLAVSNAFKVADGPEPLSVNLGVLSLRTQLDAQNGVQDVPYQGDVLLIDAITSNPGAAGGAVVSVDGQLVGMIGRIMEGKSTSTRLNYAVPVDQLYAFYQDKLQEAIPSIGPLPLAEKSETGIRLFLLGSKRDPAYIDRVVANSPAASAGLQSDDLIVSVAGQVIRNVGEFKSAMATVRPGVEIELVVKRKNDVLTIKLTPVKAD
jgi:serine protease Do